MKLLLAIAMGALLVAPAGFAKKARCTFRLHVEGSANDSSVFATRLRSASSDREVFIEKVPRISELDVAAFHPYGGGSDGNYGALIQLNDHGRLALDTLSIEHRGRSAFVFVNGRYVTELQIDRRVSDGQIYVASGLTENDIQLMARDWRLIGQRKK